MSESNILPLFDLIMILVFTYSWQQLHIHFFPISFFSMSL